MQGFIDQTTDSFLINKKSFFVGITVIKLFAELLNSFFKCASGILEIFLWWWALVRYVGELEGLLDMILIFHL